MLKARILPLAQFEELVAAGIAFDHQRALCRPLAFEDDVGVGIDFDDLHPQIHERLKLHFCNIGNAPQSADQRVPSRIAEIVGIHGEPGRLLHRFAMTELYARQVRLLIQIGERSLQPCGRPQPGMWNGYREIAFTAANPDLSLGPNGLNKA